MSNIDNILEQILDAKYGRDVRQAIHDGIEECYAETGGTGLSDEAKQALLACFEHVAWTDEHGQDYYDALENALYPPADLVSISAVYTQSGTVYDTDTLDSLKPDLVVTAVYSDSTTEVVTTYTLSGTLTEGTSTITVSYGGKTTTFNVTVTTIPYITDGLLAYWDGIDNTGSGHDASAAEWTDLVNGYELPLRESTNTTWNADSLNLSGNPTQGLMTSAPLWTTPTNATIELVVKPEATGTQCIGNLDVNSTAQTVSQNTNLRRFAVYSDNTLGFVGTSGNTYDNPESALTGIRKLVATYNDFTVVKAYANGSELSLSSKTHSFNLTGTVQYRIGFEKVATNSSAYPFTGKIYAIRVYNRVLAAEELAKNLSYDNDRFSLGLTL